MVFEIAPEVQQTPKEPLVIVGTHIKQTDDLNELCQQTSRFGGFGVSDTREHKRAVSVEQRREPQDPSTFKLTFFPQEGQR